MQKQICSLFLFLVLTITFGYSQSVGVNTTIPDTTAALDVVSTTKGMLVPRMTTVQRSMINDPATGLLVFDLSSSSFWFYDGSGWADLSSGVKDEIVDGDSDTKVVVDNGMDNDEITFETGGFEMGRMDGKTFHLSSTGGSLFIGNNAGRDDNNASNSKLAIGSSSLQTDTAGFGNLAIGHSSLKAHLTGATNTSIGYQAMLSNESGVSNVVIGSSALGKNEHGSYNTVVGADAMSNNINGQRNTAIGRAALQDNLDSINVAVGDLAGAFSQGSRNTMIGPLAGIASTGDDNVYLGHRAGENNTSNQRLYIDNTNTDFPLIHGEFDNKLVTVNGELSIGGKYRFQPTGGGTGDVLKYTAGGLLDWDDDDVDDADADPNNEIQTLSYTGEILSLSGGNSVGINEGLWEASNSEIFYDDLDVAIGLTEADARLHVREYFAKTGIKLEHAYSGASNITGMRLDLPASATGAKTGIQIQSIGGTSADSRGISSYVIAGTGTTHYAIDGSVSGTGTAIKGTAFDGGGRAAEFNGFSYFNGDMGVGTETPDAKVEIEETGSQIGLHVDHKYTGSTPFTAMRVDVPAAATGGKTALQVQTLAGTSTSTNGVASFVEAGASGTHHAFIGTVLGAGTAYRGFATDAGSKVMDMFGTSEFHGRTYFDGNVGIGTESPLSTFEVHDNTRSLSEMYITPEASTSEDSSRIFFAEDRDASFGMYWLYDGVENEMELWGKANSTTYGPHMQVSRNDGRIELNNGTIVFDPDVNGAGRVITDEIEIRGGSDLAEYFTSTLHNPHAFHPGTIVCVNGENGEIIPSTLPRDTKVIGVVSGANGIKTGMFLGQKGTLASGNIPVAITGRVYVEVSNENGSIEPGDFLTTSSEIGKAMKVKNLDMSKGAILGKALTTQKDGYVLVLIGLQ